MPRYERTGSEENRAQSSSPSIWAEAEDSSPPNLKWKLIALECDVVVGDRRVGNLALAPPSPLMRLATIVHVHGDATGPSDVEGNSPSESNLAPYAQVSL